MELIEGWVGRGFSVSSQLVRVDRSNGGSSGSDFQDSVCA